MNTQDNRKQKLIYGIGLGLTSLWFGASGFFEITKNPVVWDKTIMLGYPAYFIVTLGIAKLMGIVVLLLPNSRQLYRLKEWVFAGLYFDILFALISGVVILGPGEFIAPCIALLLVSITYVMHRNIYKVEEI